MNKIDVDIKTAFRRLEIEIEDMSAEIMADLDENVFNFRRAIEIKAKDIANVELKKNDLR